MQKIWKVNKKAPEEFLEKFPEYSGLTCQLLWDRNLKTQKSIDEFFNPDYDEDLHNPFLLKDIKKTIKRIEKAAINQEKVAIFADYDADGVCGATILTEILKVFKIHPDVYIPDRNREGYGLNLKAIKEIAKKGISLVLTIDCGITDFEEIKLANKLNINVVVIDHHEVPKKRPAAFAIINPKQKTCKYPFKHLSATGVAFKLAQAVGQIKKLSIGWEKWLLDLVAISTVVDSMLLLGENRTLVKYGLIVLSQTKRIGLKALMEKAKVNQEKLTTYTLGFILGPRINAASRVGHGTTAYKLLVSSNKSQADKLAHTLELQNQERQRIMDKIFKEAREKASKHLKKKKIIFEADEKWIAGLVGLVAQKLRDEFWRPVFICQKLKDSTTCSARSGLTKFNIVEAITKCQKFLREFGGHPYAAAFRAPTKNLEKIQSTLEKIASKEIKREDLIPVLNIDTEVKVDDLNWDVFEEIQNFAPFGGINPAPLFLLKRIKISRVRNVGANGNHLKLLLKKDERVFNAIGFGLSDFCGKIKQGDRIDAVFELITNEWNGTKSLEFKIVDLRKS